MARTRMVRVGLVQKRSFADPAANLKAATDGIREAAGRGAQVVCLQELFRSQYFCVTEEYAPFALAESVPGPTTQILQSLARKLRVVIIAPLFEKRAGGLYHNTAALIDADGSYLGKYRKMHIPDDPSFYEKFYFAPGDLGFRAWRTRYATIGVLICWDQWYPEAARLTALAGAEILFYPTAIGWARGEKPDVCRHQHNAWQTIQRSHAIANGIPVVSVNRVGVEKSLKFWGGSFVADTFGEILYQAPHHREAVAVVELDIARSDMTRVHWPFLRDRRIDAYGDLTRRFLEGGKAGAPECRS